MSGIIAHNFDRPALAAGVVDVCATRGPVLLAGTMPALAPPAPRRY